MTGTHASATAASLEWDSSCRQRAASSCTSGRLQVNSPTSVRTAPSSLRAHPQLLPPACSGTGSPVGPGCAHLTNSCCVSLLCRARRRRLSHPLRSSEPLCTPLSSSETCPHRCGTRVKIHPRRQRRPWGSPGARKEPHRLPEARRLEKATEISESSRTARTARVPYRRTAPCG